MAAIVLLDDGQFVLEKVLFDILFGLAMGGVVWFLSNYARRSRPEETLNSKIYKPNIVANLLYYGGTSFWAALALLCYLNEEARFIAWFFAVFFILNFIFGHADTVVADDMGLTQQKRFSPDVVIPWDAVTELSVARFDGPGAFTIHGRDGAKIKITPYHQGLDHFRNLVFEKTGKSAPVIGKK